jgi:hypothetical protein
MSKKILLIRFKYQRRSDLAAVLAVALIVSALLLNLGLSHVRATMQPATRAIEPPINLPSLTSPAPLRQFYLTSTSYAGDLADGSDGNGAGVCALGYHFASLWEILDPSNLRYNVNQGSSRGDSGMGPPSATLGWVRTGYNDNTSTTPGHANCTGWDQSTSNGTVVNLPDDWSDANQQDMHTWNAATRLCSNAAALWCVADEPDAPGACSQPESVFCGQQISGDTSGMPSHIFMYSCSAYNESGPDTIYALTLPAGDTYTVTATLSGLGGIDLDIFLLPPGDCYSGTCLTYHGTSLTAYDLDPGVYYIAVDGYSGSEGAYTLTVNCSKNFIYLPLIMKS